MVRGSVAPPSAPTRASVDWLVCGFGVESGVERGERGVGGYDDTDDGGGDEVTSGWLVVCWTREIANSGSRSRGLEGEWVDTREFCG